MNACRPSRYLSFLFSSSVSLGVYLWFSFSASGQDQIKVFTRPKLPPRDMLERMNLTVAWHARVTVDGQRDGIASVQLIPGKQNQLVVQTYKDAVFLYDADHGDLIWRATTIGVPYWSLQPAAWNSQCIMVSRRNILHVLNRANGSQRVYHFEPPLRDPIFGFTLQFAPSATLVADEDFVYVVMANRLHAVYIPDFEGLERAKRAAEEFEKKMKDGKKEPMPEQKKKEPVAPEDTPRGDNDSPQPFVYWAYKLADATTDAPPIFSEEQISVISSTGSLISMNRFDAGPRRENFEFQVKGNTPGGAAQHNATAYFGASDFNVYAVNMRNGVLLWRHIAGAPVLQRPLVNDRDVFVTPERTGLRKLERQNGREVWTNRDAERFLATNEHFVYALNKLGKLYVLDAKRGTSLAAYDANEWTISVQNEFTDRIYLAANDGQILCLRHRDLTKPLVMKVTDEYRREEKKDKKEEKKDEEKKEEKKEEKASIAFDTSPFAMAMIRRSGPMRPRISRGEFPAWALR